MKVLRLRLIDASCRFDSRLNFLKQPRAQMPHNQSQTTYSKRKISRISFSITLLHLAHITIFRPLWNSHSKIARTLHLIQRRARLLSTARGRESTVQKSQLQRAFWLRICLTSLPGMPNLPAVVDSSYTIADWYKLTLLPLVLPLLVQTRCEFKRCPTTTYPATASVC